MFNYFDIVHKQQPHRQTFAVILSNFDTAFIFEADYQGASVTIFWKPTPTLADAIIYVHHLSHHQYEPIPPIHTCLSSSYSVINNLKHHALLSVPFPTVDWWFWILPQFVYYYKKTSL